MNTAEKALIEALASVQKVSVSAQDKFKGEVLIASVRLEALRCLKERRTVLDAFILKVKGSKVDASGSSSSGGIGGVGNAPPSQRYEELLTLEQLGIMPQEVWEKESAEEITQLKKKIVDNRAPTMELIVSCNQAVKDIEKLHRSLKNDSAKPKAKHFDFRFERTCGDFKHVDFRFERPHGDFKHVDFRFERTFEKTIPQKS